MGAKGIANSKTLAISLPAANLSAFGAQRPPKPIPKIPTPDEAAAVVRRMPRCAPDFCDRSEGFDHLISFH